MSIRNTLASWKSNLTNFSSYRTKRKIVVFESDDWGSIRMPSVKILNDVFYSGRLKPGPYERYDCLEQDRDLERLFSTLSKFSDHFGNHPVFTANTVMANPDFDAIKADNFHLYYYEPFTESYKRSINSENCLRLVSEGISNKLFIPQFHGREHVNANVWLRLLRDGNPDIRRAFDLGFWSLPRNSYSETEINLQASFDAVNEEFFEFQHQAICDGLNIFRSVLGYPATSFIANNFTWSSRLNETLTKNGITFLQGMIYQKLPLAEGRPRRYIRHHTGERNSLNQLYLVRNCIFEPSQSSASFDSVGYCLSQVANAFMWNTVAIISTHRLNFMGGLDERNQLSNLQGLEELISQIMKRWPCVEFMDTATLGAVIGRKAKI